jgi:hypothetical protein
MESNDATKLKLTTSSAEEGLDFACHLIATALSTEADAHPECASRILRTFSQYVELRYVGELELAAEYLADLAREISPTMSFQRQQFWLQLQWVAQRLGLPAQDYEEERR